MAGDLKNSEFWVIDMEMFFLFIDLLISLAVMCYFEWNQCSDNFYSVRIVEEGKLFTLPTYKH